MKRSKDGPPGLVTLREEHIQGAKEGAEKLEAVRNVDLRG
jgi:hypothetical protein